MTRRASLAVLVASVLIGIDARAQSVLFVDDDAAPNGDGSSWAMAYRDLRDALAKAGRPGSTVEEIWVAAGTYRPDKGTMKRSGTFSLPPNVDLLGGFVGNETDSSSRDPNANVTLLMGDLKGDDGPGFFGYADNSFHVITCDQAGTGHTIDGFVLHGGNASSTTAPNDRGAALYVVDDVVTIARCTFDANKSYGRGGAVFAQRATLVCRSCTFSGNQSRNDGGAVRVETGTLTISECGFADNESNEEGGALHVVDCAIDISSTSFDRNTARTHGGGAYLHLSVNYHDRALGLADCSFAANYCQYGGGGLWASTDGGKVQVSRCSFVGNETNDGSGSGGGALVGIGSDSSATITDTEFIENIAQDYGGGLFIDTLKEALVDHCTFRSNVSEFAGGAIADQSVGIGSCDLQYVGCRIQDNHAVNGGGISSETDGTLLVHGCLIMGSSASDDCGALFANHDTIVEQSTVAYNTATSSIGGIGDNQSTSRVSDTILWQNSDSTGSGQTSEVRGFVDASYCCIEGWDGTIPGVDSFGADPLFVDPGSGDLRLEEWSPCIEAGDDSLTYAVEPFDLDGHSRIDDGDFDGHLRLDLGALEFTHINLAITGDPTPGGTIEIITSGTAGLPAVLIFAVDPGTFLVDPFGYLGVDEALCLALTWDPAPADVAIEIPPDFPATDYWVQVADFFGAAGDVSNLIELNIR